MTHETPIGATAYDRAEVTQLVEAKNECVREIHRLTDENIRFKNAASKEFLADSGVAVLAFSLIQCTIAIWEKSPQNECN